MSGTDATITIPSVRITLDDGAKLKAVLTGDMRMSDNVKGILHVNKDQYAGADAQGARCCTPNPYQSGSSVSHYDTIAFRNLLMEPAINSDLPVYRVTPPKDLTCRCCRTSAGDPRLLAWAAEPGAGSPFLCLIPGGGGGFLP
jgi:hypothetical protein